MRIALAALAVMLSLLACGTPSSHGQITVGPISADTAGSPVDVLSVFSAAMNCTTLSFSIQEAGNAGFSAATDGSITSAGIYTPPTCGSSYAGTTEHIIASGCNETASAAVSNTPAAGTIVAILIPFASCYTNCATAPTACWATKGLCSDGTTTCDPSVYPVTACGSTTDGKCHLQAETCDSPSTPVQFYYETVYTCGGQSYTTPASPAPPSTRPPTCP